jgi:SagB-type dehydrogenase family enzyme
VCYWTGGVFVICNYATRTRVVGTALVCEVLDFFDDWRPLGDLLDALGGRLGRQTARRMTDRMVGVSLLQRSDRPHSRAEAAMAAWATWNPAAGLFHALTRNVPVIDPRVRRRWMLDEARRSPPPPPVRPVAGAPVIELPAPVLEGEFAGVLTARRTWRRFSRGAVPLEALATLTGLTAGIQAWRTLPGRLGEIPLKTYPSGGARHPLELYVFARDVRGLERGLYHYAADRHVLERLPARAGRRRVEDYLPRQYWFEPAGVVVFFTAVFARTRWRYRFARAYRAILAEAGHACQTFCLVATHLGLAPFCSMALADSRIEADLGIDGISEAVLYAAGAGLRPARESAGSSPPDLPARPVRPNLALRPGRRPR